MTKIKHGDYVVHGQLTFEQYMKFIGDAKASGLTDYIFSSTGRYERHTHTVVLCTYICGSDGNTVNCVNNITERYAKKQFTINDLKSGMKVVYRDGRVRYVFRGDLYKACYDNSLVYQAEVGEGEFGDNLEHGLFKEMDIMKVYGEDHKLLWERVEENPIIELTLEEVASKMGVDVNQLRIKD